MIRLLLRQIGVLLGLALIPAAISGAIQLRWVSAVSVEERSSNPSSIRPGPRLKNAEKTVEGEVMLETVLGWGERVQWVDARPRAKFDREHIPGAVLLNEDEWDQLVPGFLNEWDPEKKIVIYCDGGACEASHAVAKKLREEMQLSEVWVLKGGWDAWQAK